MKRFDVLRAPCVCAAFLALLATMPVLAHEGHGLQGAHAHPSDVWGFLMLGLVIGLAVWISRKK